MSNQTPETPDWQAMRKECEQGNQSIADIARAHGITPQMLYQKRSKWKAQTKEKPDCTSDDDETIDHLAMVQRLYHATDQQIRHLEKRLESGDAAFDEKEARMLGTIARTVDKILELVPKRRDTQDSHQGAARKSQVSEGAHDQGEDQSNLDGLREELARRLDKLRPAPKGGVSRNTE